MSEACYHASLLPDRDMASPLDGKVAIVTGASSGIGEAIAVLFAANGASVTLSGREEGRLQAVQEKLIGNSGGQRQRFTIFKGDLNEASVREGLLNHTVQTFGRLDILVANAGVAFKAGSIFNGTEEAFDSVLDTNLKTVFFLIQKAVPFLEASRGNVLTISSNLARLVLPGNEIYSISKAALDHLIRCLALDLGPRGIRVNSINPGFIPTRLFQNLDDDVDKFLENIRQSETGKLALTSRHLTAQDVAEAALFLASEAASFITGQQLVVDGGRSLGGP